MIHPSPRVHCPSRDTDASRCELSVDAQERVDLPRTCVCVLLKKRGVYLYTCAKAAVYKVHTKGQYLTGSMAVVFLADDLPSSKLPPSQAYPPSSHHGKLHQLAWAAAVILKISMKHGKLINHFCLYS